MIFLVSFFSLVDFAASCSSFKFDAALFDNTAIHDEKGQDIIMACTTVHDYRFWIPFQMLSNHKRNLAKNQMTWCHPLGSSNLLPPEAGGCLARGLYSLASLTAMKLQYPTLSITLNYVQNLFFYFLRRKISSHFSCFLFHNLPTYLCP